MKRLVLLSILLLTFLVLPSQAQIGSFYIWTDSLGVTTTAIDSIFTIEWQSVTIWADTCDMQLKLGAPDTTGWSSRKFMTISAGGSIYIGPATKLKRLEYKCKSGAGTLYMTGYKKRRQY